MSSLKSEVDRACSTFLIAERQIGRVNSGPDLNRHNSRESTHGRYVADLARRQLEP